MPTIFDIPVVTRLPALLNDVQEGKILIPRFQRPFVWKDDQRLELMDSIYKQMPVGTLMVWRTDEHRLDTYQNLGPFRLHPPSEKQTTYTYLLDGHQRLSTLYGALHRPDEDDDFAPVGDETGANHHKRNEWPIYFELEPPPGMKRDLRFRLAQRGKPPPLTWLPLHVLFDPVRLYEFQKLLIEADKRKLAREAEALANSFKDYAIPVVPIVTNDLDAVTDSFQRVNSQGTPVNEVHMLSALLYPRQFDLNRRFEEIIEDLKPLSWDRIEPQVLLDILKVGWDLHVYSADTKNLKERLESNPTRLDDLPRFIKDAIKFLDQWCGVAGPKALPSTYQVVALTEAARVNGGGVFAPEVAESLRRWFWATSYTSYFSGMTGNQIRQAISHVRAIVTQGAPPCPPDLNQAEIEPIKKFDFSWTRSRTFALLLAQFDPKAADGSSLHAPHLLATEGSSAVTKIFARGPGSRPENRWLVPAYQLQEMRALLPESGQLSFTRDSALTVLQSHGIDRAAYDALLEDDHDRFYAARRHHLQTREREFLASLGLPLRMAEVDTVTTEA